MKKFLLVLVVVGFLFPGLALAEGVWCDGQVKHFYVDRWGGVFTYLTFRNEFVQICNLNYEWKGVATKSCDKWHDDAVKAFGLGNAVTLKYMEVNSCQDVPSYGNAPAPEYFMLKE